LRQQTQLQTVQKSVENLVDLHAAGMVQLPPGGLKPGLFLTALRGAEGAALPLVSDRFTRR
jgi:hypothetical protein